MYRFLWACLIGTGFIATSTAVPAATSTTTHDFSNTGLDGLIAVDDLISGLIATELPGDNGYHPANPASSDPLDPNGLPAFTDDVGDFSGVTGLLNDFPSLGSPTKLLQYDLPAPVAISSIQILTGNNNNDGRVFSTSEVKYSVDGGQNFLDLGYFQSDPSGSINNDGTPGGFPGPFGSTLVEIVSDDNSTSLATAVTNLQFHLYSVDNTLGEMRDPFDGVNPFTGVDDGLTAAFVSPLVYELDVLGGLTGDMDCDGDVDFDDIDDFVLGLQNPSDYEANFGVPPSFKGDTDGDGDQDFDDIGGFVDILQPAGVQHVPEPATGSAAVVFGITVWGLVRWRGGRRRWRSKFVVN